MPRQNDPPSALSSGAAGEASSEALSLEHPQVVHRVQQYRAALEDGQSPDRQELLRQFPSIAGELAACLDALDFVHEVAPRLREAQQGGPWPDTEPGSAPATLGDFRIIREIGRGGMGVVYEADQVSLGRRVALKVLPLAAVLDQRQLQRFKTEAQAAAALHHQNIVPVHGVGCERGVHYYAMQYIEGQPLSEVIRDLRRAETPETERDPSSATEHNLADSLASGQFDPQRKDNDPEAATAEYPPASSPRASGRDRAKATHPRVDSASMLLSTERSTRSPAYFRTIAKLGIQVADALDCAHQQGVIHRDIKPSNLILEASGKLWVTDFGLARMEDRPEITLTGDVVGTLRYMSPEQALAKRVVVDHRTDIYSLGVTLYELLTLQPAFTAKDRHELFQQIAFEDPRRLRQLNRGIPSELETVILKAMAKNPTERYATAQDLAEDLQRFLDDRPVIARRPSLTQRMVKWSRRHRQVVRLALALMLVAAIAGPIIALHEASLRRTADTKTQAAAAAESQSRQLAKANETLTKQERGAREEAERQLRIATAMRLAAQSQMVRQERPVQSVLLAVEAVNATREYREPVIPVAHESLRTALSSVHGRPLSGHEGGITAVAISSDGHWLVTAGGDKTVRLWDLTARHPWATPIQLEGHDDSVLTATFSANARWLVTGSLDRTARLWDLEQQPFANAFVLRGHQESVRSAAFSPNSRWLATQSRDSGLRIWLLTASDPAKIGATLSGTASYGTAEVIVAADGRWLVTPQHVSPYGGGVRLWDLTKVNAKQRRLTDDSAGGPVWAWPVAISPDCRWLVSGIRGLRGHTRDDYRLRVWDLTSDDPVRSVKDLYESDNSGRTFKIAISQDSRWLATAHGNVARLWDLTLKDPAATVRVLRGHEGTIYAIAISRHGRWLVTGGTDKTARLWDLNAEALESTARVLRGHADTIHAIAMRRDGRWLITRSSDKTARLWDLSAEAPESTAHVLRGHEGHIDHIAVSPDGHWLVTASGGDPVARLWDLTAEHLGSQDIVLRTSGPGFLMSPDGHWLAVNGSPARVWDLTAEDPRTTARDLIAEDQEHDTLSISSPLNKDVEERVVAISTKWLVTTRSDKSLHLFDLNGKDPATTRHIVPFTVPLTIRMSPDGHWLAMITSERTVRLWNLNAEDPFSNERILRGHQVYGSSLAFSPDSRWLATGCRDHTVRIWDLAKTDPSIARTLLGENGVSHHPPYHPRGNGVSHVAYSPDGRWLSTRSVDGTSSKLRLWNLNAKEPVASSLLLRADEATEPAWRTFTFSPDSRWLVTKTNPITESSKKRGLSPQFRDLPSEAELWGLTADRPTAKPLALSPNPIVSTFSQDARWLLTVVGATVSLLDLTAEDPTATARILLEAPVSAAFSPDGHWLATAGPGGRARLWDVGGADPIASAVTLHGHESLISAVGFTRDGRWLVTGSHDKTVRLWDMRIERLIELARQRAGRELTHLEMTQYSLPVSPSLE